MRKKIDVFLHHQLNGFFHFSDVHSVVPQQADELDRVLGLVLDPQQRVVHVVLTASDLAPRNAGLESFHCKNRI